MKRIIFMGTPIFAAEILEEIIKNGYNVVLVVSQPDRKVGRKQIVEKTPVKKIAHKYGIEIFQPVKITFDYEKIINLKPDLIITAAYGQFIPEKVLNAPTIESINIHGSLLPKYRGGAPIQYSILNGDTITGVSIMKMIKKMDAGDIMYQQSFQIGLEDNKDVVTNKMIKVAKNLILDKLPDILDKKNKSTPQKEEEASFAPIISKDDEKINWNMNALDIKNKIRALSTTPGAYTLLNDKRIKIFEVEITSDKSSDVPGIIKGIDLDNIYVNTKDYVLKIKCIQPEGKKKLSVKDYLLSKKKEDFYEKSFGY